LKIDGNTPAGTGYGYSDFMKLDYPLYIYSGQSKVIKMTAYATSNTDQMYISQLRFINSQGVKIAPIVPAGGQILFNGLDSCESMINDGNCKG
jgi:hypothetical protein